MNTKGYLRIIVTSGVKVIIKCCCFYLVNQSAYEYYVMYGFVLVPDCTTHFIIVLNTERAKYVPPYKLPDRFALTFLVLL